MIEVAVERYGKLDILVNNAGIQSTGENDNLLTRSVETFEHIMHVNAISPGWTNVVDWKKK